MKIHPAITTNVAFGKRLVDSSIEGASSGSRRALEEEPLTDVIRRAMREAGMPAAIGACVGAAASLWKGDGRAPRNAVLGGLVGAALGFSAGILWGSRNLTGAMVKGAVASVNATRDQHWLERHPIDYA